MYTQKMLDIFRNPQNAGGLQGATAVSRYVDETYGDVIKFYLKVNEETDVVEQARFKTMGGVVSIAASSLVTELVTNLPLKEAAELDEGNLLEVFGEVPQEKFCVLSSVIASLREAVAECVEKKEKEAEEAKKAKKAKK